MTLHLKFQQLVAYLEGQGRGPEGEARQEFPNLGDKVLVIAVEDSGLLRKNIIESLRDFATSTNLPIEIAAPDGLTHVNHALSLLSPENLNRLIEELNLRGVICLLDNNLNGLNGESDEKITMGYQIAKKIWEARRSEKFPNLDRVILIGASSEPFPTINDPTKPDQNVKLVNLDPGKSELDGFIHDGDLEKIIQSFPEIPNVSNTTCL